MTGDTVMHIAAMQGDIRMLGYILYFLENQTDMKDKGMINK